MGHAIAHTIVDNNKQAIQDFEWAYEEETARNSDGGREGLYADWKRNKVFDTYKDADEYLEQFDGSYKNVAVLFHDARNAEPPKTALANVDKLLANANKSLESILDKAEPKNLKSAYKACPDCGSKLAVKFLKLNRYYATMTCPLCGASLLSESTVSRIKAAKKRIKEAEKHRADLFETAQRKAAKKAPIRWLIKTEYHC